MINEYALLFLFYFHFFKGVPLCMRALSTLLQLSLNLPNTEVMWHIHYTENVHLPARKKVAVKMVTTHFCM